MRFKKSIRNIFGGITQQIVIILLAFINRTLFARYMGMEYLGYSSLFSNIFMWVSFVDAGFSSVMIYRFYQAVGRKDDEELSALVAFSQRIFTTLGVVIFTLGILITGIVPHLVKGGAELNTFELIGMYWIQLLGTVISYFSAGRRICFQAMQDDFICSNVDTAIKIFTSVLQVGMIAWKRSIYEYLFVAVLGNIISVLLFKIIQEKKYPGLIKKRIQRTTINGIDLIKDVKNFAVHKFCYLVYGATDSVVISVFCGAQKVARYSNYVLIYQYTSALFFGKIFDALQSSIGNFVNTETRENKKKLFDMLNVIGFSMANIVCCGYVACYQTFMKLWMGEQNLLSNTFLVLYIFTAYVTFNSEVLYKFRASYGEYADDKKWMIFSAISNLAISIGTASRFDLVGIQAGTMVGLVFIILGRGIFVFSREPEIDFAEYIKKQLLLLAIFITETIGIISLTKLMPEGFIGLVVKGALSVIISVCVDAVYIVITSDGRQTLKYLWAKVHVIRQR